MLRHQHPLDAIEVLSLVLSNIEDPKLILALENTSHRIHAARPLLHGHGLQTTISRGWSDDISQVSRLASLYRQLDRLEDVAISIEKLPGGFFDSGRCRHLTSLDLSRVETVPTCISACSALAALSLAGHFTALPECLGELRRLTHLAISTRLPDWLRGGLLLPAALAQLPQLAALQLDVNGAVGWAGLNICHRSSDATTTASSSISRLVLHNSSGSLALAPPWPPLPALAALYLSGYVLPGLTGLARLLVAADTTSGHSSSGLTELRCCFADAGAFGPGGLPDLLVSLAAAAPAPAAFGDAVGPLGRLRALHLEAPATGLRERPQAAAHQGNGEGPAAAAAADNLRQLFGGWLVGLTSLSLLLQQPQQQRQGVLGNSSQQFYDALPQLRGLQQLTLRGLDSPPSPALAALPALTVVSVTAFDSSTCASPA